MNFTAGQQSATLMLPTVDDNATELYECFKVVIEQVHIIRVINKPFSDVTVLVGSQYCLWICIKDNDLGTSDNTIRLCFFTFCICLKVYMSVSNNYCYSDFN